MANFDPITGLSLDQNQAPQTVDYLGRSSPLGLAQQTALPGAQGAAPSAGPASVGGTGVAAPTPSAGQSVGAGFGQNTFSPSIPGLGTQLGAAAAGTILGQGKSQLQNFLPAGGQETTSAPEGIFGGVAPSGPVSGPTTGLESIQAPVNIFADAARLGPASESILAPAGIFGGVAPSGPASTELGAASLGASAGELGAGSLLGAYGGLSAGYDLGKLALKLAGIQGGPTTGNTWGDLGLSLLGGPIADPAKALIGELIGPSSAWQSFGSRLGGTLGGESSAINTLVPWLGRAQTRGDIDQSLDLFRQLVETGAGVGGYQLGGRTASGAPQVGQLPGALGSKHEGGLTADFGPVTTALNDYISKLYDVLPEGAASGPTSYEAYAAGMPQAEFDNFMTLANGLLGKPLQEQQMAVAASGLSPDRQDQLLRYVGNPATYSARGLPIPEEFGGGNPMGFGYGGGQGDQ